MERGENLWLKMLREFWADPKNVIGPPGALVRRIFKTLWFALALYVLFFVAGPSQVASWRLWMADDGLAWNIAWGFTIAGALAYSIVRYAAEGTKPFRIPTPLPLVDFNEWAGGRVLRGWRVRMAHVHIPNITVLAGSALVVGLFTISLLGMWNYYLHDNMQSGGASVIANEGASSNVTDAQAALAAFEARAARAADDRSLAARSCNTGYSPTGCSRLAAAHTAAERTEAAERARLTDALRTARGERVTTAETATDPRPVDQQVAQATGLARGLVASLLDLARSGIVEALLILGAGLSLTAATSQIGVPREAQSTETGDKDEADAETVTATEGAPQEPEPAPPPPRRRFVLPVATAEDIAKAFVVGPAPRPELQLEPDAAIAEGWESKDGDEALSAPEEPAAENAVHEAPEAIDPLIAEAMAQAEQEEAA